MPVARAGTYHVKVGVQTKPNKGTFQLAINGVSQGAVQDEYNASVGYAVRDLGTVYLNSGNFPRKTVALGERYVIATVGRKVVPFMPSGLKRRSLI